MYISSCLNDTDSDAADQSVTLTASGDGYTVTFTKGSSSVWLNTSRIPHIPSGGANQIPVGDTIGSGSVWQFTSVPTPPPTDDDDDFDGQTLYVWHETDDSEGCLDVKHGNRTNGQDVQTWDCNKSDAQKWIFEKRAAGDYQGSYRLVSALGSDTHCLDNRGDFATGERMGIWQCVGDANGAASNQSVTIAESGDGYTITFVRNSDSKSVWLVTDRTSTNPKGGANQATVTDTVPASAVWRIGADAPANDPPANNPPANNPPPPPQAQNEDSDTDPFDDQIVQIYQVDGTSTACLSAIKRHSQGWTKVNENRLEVAECSDSAFQQWRLEKMTSGAYLIRSMAAGQYNCLDNHSHFETNSDLKPGRCAVNSNYKPSDNTDKWHYYNPVVDQSVTITAEGDGYTLKFDNGSKSSWITTDRAAGSTSGNAGQTSTADTVPASAVWGIGTVEDRVALRTNPTLVKPVDEFHDKTFRIKHRYKSEDGWIGSCLHPGSAFPPKFTPGNYLVIAGAYGGCHESNESSYHSYTAMASWKVERRSSGDFAGYYRFVHQHGNKDLCLDADVADTFDGGLEYTTTPTTRKYGIYIDTCVGDDHADVASQSVKITRHNDGDGAWGKDSYTLTFVEDTSDDAREAWLSVINLIGRVGQRVVTDDVHAKAIFYLEEQVHSFLPTLTPASQPSSPAFAGQTVQVQHVIGNSTACLTVPDNTVSDGKELTTAACDSAADGQKWQVEQRTGGDAKDFYRLVSAIGDDTHCLDNRGEFATSDRMGIWTCANDTHTAALNQSVIITASGDGYTLTFTRRHYESWLTTDRAADTPAGNVGQTSRVKTVPASAV